MHGHILSAYKQSIVLHMQSKLQCKLILRQLLHFRKYYMYNMMLQASSCIINGTISGFTNVYKYN